MLYTHVVVHVFKVDQNCFRWAQAVVCHVIFYGVVALGENGQFFLYA